MSVIIGLHQPKYIDNLSNIRRTISCYGGGQIQSTGLRLVQALAVEERLPRPLRDRRYGNVTMDLGKDAFEFPDDYTPVAIEVGGSENLAFFEHPQNAVYIFGPEDGSLPPAVLRKCHRHVMIPTLECLNLAITVSTVLYDRMQKAWTSIRN